MTRFVFLLFICPVVCFSQKRFTISQLFKINTLSEKRLTKYMHHRGFSLDNRYHDRAAKIIFIGFIDKSGQTLQKRFEEENSSYRFEFKVPFDSVYYRSELIKRGYKLMHRDNYPKFTTIYEFYQKPQHSVGITYAKQPDNKLPFYSITIFDGKQTVESTIIEGIK